MISLKSWECSMILSIMKSCSLHNRLSILSSAALSRCGKYTARCLQLLSLASHSQTNGNDTPHTNENLTATTVRMLHVLQSKRSINAIRTCSTTYRLLPRHQYQHLVRNTVLRERNLIFNLTHSRCSVNNMLLVHCILFGRHPER
jgi:hypothetical protein